ncbi:hypothetical protein [Mesorhizobium sp. A556]
MEDELENTSPAGEVMTDDAAADILAKSMLGDETETNQPDPEAENDDLPRADDDPENKADGEKESDEDEPEYYDIEKLDPDMPMRLRDGTTVRWGDVKRDMAELRELPRHKQEIETQRASVSQHAAQTARQAQFFQQVMPLVEHFMQANAPKPPEMPTEDPNDPLGNSERWNHYNRQVAEFQGKQAQVQQLMRAREHFQAQQNHQTEAQKQEQLRMNQHKLFEVMPTLRDEAKRTEFARDMKKFGQDVYGFSEEELNGVGDYRLIPMIRDAIAYRKLQASKPKAAEKAKDAAPVRQPGKRTSDAERSNSAYREERAKLRKTGRADDAVALLAKALG